MIKNWSKRLKILMGVVLLSASLIGIKDAVAPVHAKDWDSPYIDYVVKSNPKVSNKIAKEIVVASYRWASEFNIDVRLLLAIARVESNFYQHAISPSGAYGLMQVIPVWHKDKIIKARQELGNPEIFNVNTNIYLGAWVLKDCMKRTASKTSKALLCYSGQTPGYDSKVMSHYSTIQRL